MASFATPKLTPFTKTMRSPILLLFVEVSLRGDSLSLFSSLRGRQLLSCLALRPKIGPNALPLTNQKPNEKGEGLYPPKKGKRKKQKALSFLHKHTSRTCCPSEKNVEVIHTDQYQQDVAVVPSTKIPASVLTPAVRCRGSETALASILRSSWTHLEGRYPQALMVPQAGRRASDVADDVSLSTSFSSQLVQQPERTVTLTPTLR